jgi:hypothetical protein
MNTLKIVDDLHVAQAWIYLGAKNAAEYARSKADEHGVVGMNVLADLLEADLRAQGAELSLRNIGVATEHGFKASADRLKIRTGKDGVWLEWEPLDDAATPAQQLGAGADGDAGVVGVA